MILKNALIDMLLKFDIFRRCVYGNRIYPFLESKGWPESNSSQIVVDNEGNYIPWFTYPIISFLLPRLTKSMDVFEYGSGYSTIWWSNYVASVIACEDNLDWYNNIKPKLAKNVIYKLCKPDETGNFFQVITDFKYMFDIIVIDGMDRVNLAKNSIEALKIDGVIIWDDTERSKYFEGTRYLEQQLFKRLDFWGLGPVGAYEKCTSIFYRSNNCLGI